MTDVTVTLTGDPLAVFRDWHEEWSATRPADAAAAALATADARGRPSARLVDVTPVDDGFLFFTNHGSRKALDVVANPQAELCFAWIEIGRQVRVFGSVARIGDVDSDRHFAQLPRPLALAAWVSDQRTPLERDELESRIRDAEERFAGQEIPRPLHWGGYRLVPDELDFWQQRGRALPERRRFVREGPDGRWRAEAVSP